MVEVEVSHERGSSPKAEPVRRAFEIWTQNNIYALDSRMLCIEVRSSASGRSVSDHPFVGTRLVGGQRQTENEVELSYPLPKPGSFAVFEARQGRKRRYSRTSAVERVVVRMRIVTITGSEYNPSLDDVADILSEPGEP
jgi:hypothetical protein